MEMNVFYRKSKGFTLIELLVVMSVLAILMTIAVPSYKRSQIKARESVLAEDLYQIRKAIDAFYADNASYPDSLSQLVDKHYLRGLPRDPFTKKTDTWKCIAPEPAEGGQVAEGGCFDIQSGSDLIGLDGIPYQEW